MRSTPGARIYRAITGRFGFVHEHVPIGEGGGDSHVSYAHVDSFMGVSISAGRHGVQVQTSQTLGSFIAIHRPLWNKCWGEPTFSNLLGI